MGNDPVNGVDPTGKDGAPPPSFGYALGLEIAVAKGDMTREEASAALNQANPLQTAGVLLAGSFYVPGPEDIAIAAVAARIGNMLKGSKAASGLGDLTKGEVKQIQGVVDEAGRPLDVVGSAARGERRAVGSGNPIGKGPGTKSDIDYTTAGSNQDNFRGLENKLPDADPNAPILQGVPDAGTPSIRFEPGTQATRIERN